MQPKAPPSGPAHPWGAGPISDGEAAVPVAGAPAEVRGAGRRMYFPPHGLWWSSEERGAERRGGAETPPRIWFYGRVRLPASRGLGGRRMDRGPGGRVQGTPYTPHTPRPPPPEAAESQSSGCAASARGHGSLLSTRWLCPPPRPTRLSSLPAPPLPLCHLQSGGGLAWQGGHAQARREQQREALWPLLPCGWTVTAAQGGRGGGGVRGRQARGDGQTRAGRPGVGVRLRSGLCVGSDGLWVPSGWGRETPRLLAGGGERWGLPASSGSHG